MPDRAEFLESIKHRTCRGRYKPTNAPDSVWTPSVDRPGREPIEDPPARFIQELEALGAHGRRGRELGRGARVRPGSGKEREAELLLRWDVEYLDELGADEPLREAGVEVALWRDLPELREVAGRADIGLSTAAWAIAETGSLVLEHGPGQGRSVTLLPPTYVAVLRWIRYCGRFQRPFEKYAGGTLPANVCFHTGPSRSGDIEMSLLVGMHGPGDVHVLLVG